MSGNGTENRRKVSYAARSSSSSRLRSGRWDRNLVPSLYAEFFEGSEAETGDLYVELAGKSTYNASSTPCAGHRPIASIFDRIEVHVSGPFR